LRRPFSIHRNHSGDGRIEVLYRILGAGTGLLSRKKKGDILDLLGPLGQGFRLDGAFSHAVIAAGGMGIAPVFFLIDELLRRKKEVTLFWGVKGRGELFGLDDLENSGVVVNVSTEDGSLGHRGMVTDVLRPFLSQPLDRSSMAGFVCGPKGMIREIQKMSHYTGFFWQVSAEEKMACGVGVCAGCGIRLKRGEYRMVCSDGPVFDLKEMVFDD
jgi:dihydroorotate dehydrogenase electron transfer subunit